MSFIETIYERAKANPQRVVVPECTNPSMMRAAVKAAADGLAKITFVVDAETNYIYIFSPPTLPNYSLELFFSAPG